MPDRGISSIKSTRQTLDMFKNYMENDGITDDLYQSYQRPTQDDYLLAYLRGNSTYSRILDQIEADSYHMAVRLAMDAIVTRYDHDVE
jgi:hypothetical protein